MKTSYKIISLFVLPILSLQASESKLSEKLDSLNIPSDKVTPLVSKENLFAVNDRYSSLTKRHEVSFFGANNFNSDSHIETTQSGAAYRFHINSRWSVGAKYSEYSNKLSGAGKKLFDNEQLLPDTDYALKSTEGFISFNTIYGKLRLTRDTIVYFDQYIALGYGDVALANGEQKMTTLDLGLAFWLGRKASARVGLKNEFYTQQKINGSSDVQNAMGYMEFGYLFGEGARI